MEKKMAENFDMIQKVYAGLSEKISKAREVLGRPMTYAEKILYSHLWDETTTEFKGGLDYVDLAPDRVAMQDATAQMALLQFMHSGRNKVAVPSTAHADHLIQARDNAIADLDSEDGSFHSDNTGVYHYGFKREI